MFTLIFSLEKVLWVTTVHPPSQPRARPFSTVGPPFLYREPAHREKRSADPKCRIIKIINFFLKMIRNCAHARIDLLRSPVLFELVLGHEMVAQTPPELT